MKHLALQMVNLPAGSEGLSWIASRNPGQLQLIPGLQPASIAAAAAGDQQALAYMRFTAQHHAEYPGVCALNDVNKACLLAAEVSSNQTSDGPYRDFWAELGESNPQVNKVLTARREFTVTQMAQAVCQGEVAALMWLRAICPTIWRLDNEDCEDFMYLAAESGHLEILKYLHSENDLGCWDDETTEAAVPHLECLKWLLFTDSPEGHCTWGCDLLGKIARHHGLPALEWVDAHWQFTEECWISDILKAAAEKGDQPMAEWLRAHDPPAPWDASVCIAAVQRGDISMLSWLRSQNPPCPWDKEVCKAAADCYDFSMLAWLRGQDPPCPWDESLTEAAAADRNLQMLQWLRAQEPPCPWSPGTCAAAVRAGQLEILIWLRSQDPPCPWDETCATMAAHQADLKILLWIHDNLGLQQAGTTLECMRIAARQGNLSMLEWLSSRGVPLTGELYIAAAERSHSHMLRFLHGHKVPRPQAQTVKQMRWCRLPVLMFLSDIGVRLHKMDRHRVRQARTAWCLFHALVRWCRRAVSEPSRKAHLAFDSLAEDRSGQLLLTRLSQLPPELVSKIAVVAGLQHDILITSTAPCCSRPAAP